MEVVPLSVGVASCGWDEQHLDLAAASGQIGATSTAGFTGPVAGAASRFTASWERHTRGLGTSSEARADALRDAIRDYMTSDDAQRMQLLVLASYLREAR